MPPSTNLIPIYDLATNRKIKKYQVTDVISEHVKNAIRHSSRSDYWHRCYLLLFYFSSVSNELN